MSYDPNNDWHSAVNLMLTVDCDTCHATFVSPTLGLIVAAGADAAVVATEAHAAGWQLRDGCTFRCPSCCRRLSTH
jgi:hypothetical protein